MIPALLLCLVGQLHSGDTLEAVRFEGSRAFSSRVLASLVAAEPRKPSSEIQLNGDIAALESFYHNQGFPSVEVDKQVTRGKRRPVVTFHITEGPRTRLSAIAIAGNVTVGTERLLRQLAVRPGRFFAQPDVDQSKDAIETYYLNSGYPYVQVQTEIARNDTLATVTFDISEGNLCHLSKVLVRGNRTVSPNIILTASEVKRGELFSQKHLREAQRRLYATKLFYRVMYYVIAESTEGMDSVRSEVPDSVIVRFDVSEQPYRGVTLGGGVEYQPFRVILAAGWEHDNLFDRGHTLLINGEGGPTLFPFGDYRLAFDGTYRVPYLVLTRIDFQTRPYFSYERADTSHLQHIREIGVETGMSRSFVPQFTAGLTNRLRLISDTASGITNSLVLTGRYDTRDDIFDPGQGLSVQAALEGAGGPLSGTNDLYRLTLDVRVYQRLGVVPPQLAQTFGDFVLAVRAMGGVVRPYGKSEREGVPYYESFTLGGANTLRGYGDRSIGPDTTEVGGYRYGPTVVNGNLELRSPYLLRLVGLVGFADAGGVSFDLSSVRHQYSVGTGIRVKTPIGPVRFDWGKRLRNSPAHDRGQFYLGVLHAF